MLIDEGTIRLCAGNGGKGAVAFQKVRLAQGPTGADGGRGANIYFEGCTDINALSFYANKKEIHAEDGKDGRGQFIDGRAGVDLVLRVPAGTRITNLDTGFVKEIIEPGERLLVAGGGKGGRGNFKFRSATNTTPKEFEEGTVGDIANYKLELRLLADPGLIEGASQGRGLGVKFLKHVERTKTLFHLVSAESDDVVRDYNLVRTELGQYNSELLKKDEHVFLTN